MTQTELNPVGLKERSLNVMVVEGDIEARRRLAALLKERDANVALAKTAAEAVEMMDDARFLEFAE